MLRHVGLALFRQHDVVLMQAANNAHLQQMTAEVNICPTDNKLKPHQETVVVPGIGKHNLQPEKTPGAEKMQRNTARKERQTGVNCFPHSVSCCAPVGGL